ncbi:MAG: helicase-exonuclease AddAB subunit AddA [Oscillospiraceae bacterium]
MSFAYTENQRRAITARGGSLLVSSAAGSGKTRVLTQRLMEYVTDENDPKDIDRFLVITYTRAAAAELRGRILDELAARAAADPSDKRLRRQQNLCYRAPIGTIHSFCTTVLRENCQHLGLSPAFKVMEEERAETMRAAVLTKVLDARYEAPTPAFRALADSVGAGRDDRRLVSTVLSLHQKLRSHPDPERWAAEQIAALNMEGVTDVGESVWGRELLDSIRAEAVYWSGQMDAAVEQIFSADAKISKAYGESFQATAAALRDFVRALDGGWDRAKAFLPIPFSRLGALRNYEDQELAGRVKAVREGCKKAAEGFAEVLDGNSEQQIRDMQAVAPAMEELLRLTLDFDRAFAAEKKRQGWLDFSDLEHYAARLLVDRDTGAPTWIAVELSQRYVEIMVDEYQDVSPVQDRIFRAVSRAGRNLFLVGDVKQSIYRFRLADPSLFLEKYRTFAPYETAGEGEPRRILLQENFRSRRCVLDAANLVFSNIMSRELGELDYDADAALVYGAQGYPEGSDVPAELCLIDPPEGDDEESPEKSELEARYVAARIREMVESRVQVWENGVSRDCGYGDFVILMRSPAGKGAIFRRCLAEAGIPVQSKQGGGFFKSLEVSVAVDLLSLIDNPHADVPLISVLRSPVFGFTPDELSAIRAGDRKSDFYGAVCTAAEAGDAHCRDFLEKLRSWRALAPDLGLDALIWRVYGDTDLPALCSAMSGGDERRQNLLRLFEYARSFEASGYRGVFRFTAYLRRLAEKGLEPETGTDAGAVKIMSIHKSKGLEFPFVFLCDLAHRFNKSDSKANVLLHTELGLGPKRTDRDRGVEYPTVARRAVERRLGTELLSEEMRVLYVGMTRARERLILTCVWKNAGEGLAKLGRSLTSPIAPDLLRAAPSPSRWVAMAAMLGGEIIKTQIISDVAALEKAAAAAGAACAPDEEAYRRIRENLAFAYPHPRAVELPTKVTATGLKGRAGEEEAFSESAPLAEEERPYAAFRPIDLGGERSLSAAEKGVATHSFLQYADFDRLDSPASIRAEIDRLAAAGRLSPQEAEAVDAGAVAGLFASPLGREMLGADELRREFRFTLLVDAADFFDVPPGEELLLQGIVDCFFVKDGAITVVDYKTDRVTAEQVPARAARYAPQLRAYAMALGRILKKPVRRCVLWFLRPGQAFDVDFS